MYQWLNEIYTFPYHSCKKCKLWALNTTKIRIQPKCLCYGLIISLECVFVMNYNAVESTERHNLFKSSTLLHPNDSVTPVFSGTLFTLQTI